MRARLPHLAVLALTAPLLLASGAPPSDATVTPSTSIAHQAEVVDVTVDTSPARAGLGVRLVGGGEELFGVTGEDGTLVFDVRGTRAPLTWDVPYEVTLDADDDRRFGSSGDDVDRFTIGWYRTAPSGQADVVPGTIRRVDTAAATVVMAQYSVPEATQLVGFVVPCLGCGDPIHGEFRWTDRDTFIRGLGEITREEFESALERRDTGDFTVDYQVGGGSTWRLEDPVPFHAVGAPPVE